MLVTATVGEDGKAYALVSTKTTTPPPPEIKEGWWTDVNDNKITEARLGDSVRFHIKTKDIKDRETLNLTLRDWDGMFNPDDYPEGAPTAVTINGNKGHVEFTIPQGWKEDIEDDYSDEIELYFDVEYQGESYELPTDSADYLIAFVEHMKLICGPPYVTKMGGPYDLNGNRIDELEKSNISSVDPTSDRGLWDDLMDHSNSQASSKSGGRFKSASGERVDIQGINQTIGKARNVDYYSLDISKLPNGYSKEEFFEYFRTNLNDFVGAGTDFKEFSAKDNGLWLSMNPLNAVMQFDGSPFPVENDFIEDWISDDLTVVVTDYKVAATHSYWVFSTATTLKNGAHAVSGSRQFGISENINGGFTFWTRGTDRAYNLFDDLISPIVFASGEKIWRNLFRNVNKFINENGGQSEITTPISERIGGKSNLPTGY